MSINRVVITGHLTRDAEVRRTASGTAIVSFSVAVNDRRRNQQTGEWEDYPNFIDVTWFGTYADRCSASLTKGVKVTVDGKLRQSRWTASDGQNRSKIEVIAEEVEMPSRQQGQHNAYAQQAQPSSYYDQDIPF